MAELCSLFLTADLGLPTDGRVAENTAAYLQSWISALRKDQDVLFTASSDAEKAAGMIKKNFERVREEARGQIEKEEGIKAPESDAEITDDKEPIASYAIR